MDILYKLLLAIIISISICGFRYCNGDNVFSFPIHHRYSDPVKKWSEKKTGKVFPFNNRSSWPIVGSVEYYAELAERDRLLLFRFRPPRSRDRRIQEEEDVEGLVSFADGNSTFRISSLGFLHYTTVSLGTPGMKFLVALDTGSDLFWVPCDCSSCAPTEGTSYASDFDLSIYNPIASSTSKKVTCNNSLCSLRNKCIGTFSNCPYTISYVSAETSTSGILVQDVLHLSRNDSYEELIEPYITFGCGQVQTGSFLDVAAPNGLFGLGIEKISVPSILSSQGYISDSFSMCFGNDGIGKISFGDKGSVDQDETPFNINPSRPTYNISITQFRIGTDLVDFKFDALFDSGTSFTYLIDPSYTKLSESFHSQAKDARHLSDPRIPFEFCYDMSGDANTSLIPSMSLTMKGGNQFEVYDPIIVISSQTGLLYCLAVVKSTELNIIGQNFMTGYRVVFDREKYVLGWKKFDCYNIENNPKVAVQPDAKTTTEPSAVAVGVGNHTIPKSDNDTTNISESRHNYASVWNCLVLFIILLGQV